MAHEITMREPKKVLESIDQGAEIIKKMKGTIDTVADIGNMDLAIGGADRRFAALEQLQPHMDEVLKVFNDIKERIEEDVAHFQRMNGSFEI